MPDMAVHYYFGQSVLSALPEKLNIDHGVFDFALSGPDDWFYCFTNPELWWRGRIMHNTKTGTFLRSLAVRPELFSYFAGYVCHYVLDSSCHPYIMSRTGKYDGTPQTRLYRGRHTALERALDRWILGDNAGKHPITDKMLGRPLPADIADAINQAYKSTYGWENVFDDLLRAKRSMHRYMWILENPHGKVRFITYVVPYSLIKPVPYSRHFYEKADILNTSHKEWTYPKDPQMRDCRSFPELLEDSRNMAVEMIEAASCGDLSKIGNLSYMTGLDLNDPRNKAADVYSLLEGL